MHKPQAYRNFVVAYFKVFGKQKKEIDQSQVSDLWTSVIEILSDETSVVKSEISSAKKICIPKEVAYFLIDEIRGIIANKPGLALAVSMGRKGPSAYGTNVVFAIENAILYVNACKLGIVIDKTPRRNVVQAYGIKDGTFAKWRKKFGKNPTCVAQNFEPEVSDKIRGSAIKLRMTEGAKIYRAEARADIKRQ